MKSNIRRLVSSAVRRTGNELVRRDFYSPIPFETPRAVWDAKSPLAGIEFDLESQTRWLEEAAGLAKGWVAPEVEMYGPVDAEVLYGAIKKLQPANVVELGSGVSSGIICDALGRQHDIYDPVPNDRTTLHVNRISATDVPLDVFEALGDGDVLFVDTTHTVKTGGDVNRIFLDVFPILKPGVVVHVHDIFLPFEYPYEWAEEGRLWAEQYLLQAFLVGNSDWEILCGCNAVSQMNPDRVAQAIPRFRPGRRPGAFWIRRKAGL